MFVAKTLELKSGRLETELHMSFYPDTGGFLSKSLTTHVLSNATLDGQFNLRI
jgi:hypothetical protein